MCTCLPRIAAVELHSFGSGPRAGAPEREGPASEAALEEARAFPCPTATFIGGCRGGRRRSRRRLWDAAGNYLDGGRTYRLTVPLPVPAGLFWSVTAYDARTRSEVVAEQGQAALRSLFEKLEPADGADSVDPYFGPVEPPGAEGRWIQTVPGRGWFTYFRIYGPEQAAFDGSWKPGDFESLEA